MGPILSNVRSATRRAEKIATRNTSFQVSFLSVRVGARPQSLIHAKTVATSQVHLGVIAGGRRRNRALMNLETSGCSPTEGEESGCSMEEIADRCTPTVLQTKFFMVER